MNKMACNVVAIVVLLTASFTVVHSQSLAPARVSQAAQQRLSEEFSFLIKDFKIDHQGETSALNIAISYRYVVDIKNSDYSDFRLPSIYFHRLLSNYPNKTDYWEIVNKR